LDSCCEVCAGLLIPVPTIAAQVNDPVRVAFAVRLSSRFRLSWSRPGFCFSSVNAFTFFPAQQRPSFFQKSLGFETARDEIAASDENGLARGTFPVPIRNREYITLVIEMLPQALAVNSSIMRRISIKAMVWRANASSAAT
jgi:hypothetical protein